MYLYPFKIFTISKNKRLLDVQNPSRTVGVYDVHKMNHSQAVEVAEQHDAKVSVLLGDLPNKVRLMVLDLDDCFIDGVMENETKEFLKEFSPNEYEVSSSGTGIHVYILTRMQLETFIVKDLEGCKSFECYTNKRHIVTTTFDFNQDLLIGKHDKYIEALYDKAQKVRKAKCGNPMVQNIKTIFNGEEIKANAEIMAKMYNRTPVTDMFTLRGCGYKDTALIEIIDEEPDTVDQSAHDARLIRKLLYYTFSFDAAWELATKTNYWKHKDDKHKKKWYSEAYKERTRKFIGNYQ